MKAGSAAAVCGVIALLHAILAGAASAPPAVGCLIEPERVAELGAPVIGIVESIRVDRGDAVAAGQTLAVLRAEVEHANLAVAERRARLEADVAAAAANLQLAEQRLTRSKELNAVDFVAQQAVDQAIAEREVAAQRLAQAREQVTVWTEEVSVARAQVGLRTVRSPFAGVVVERYANPGERIEEKPILRVAMIDPLRVELIVPVAYYGSIAVGSRLTVTPELPNASPVTGRVTRIDKVIDSASNSFRVRLSVPNPGNKLPAGLRCKADLQGNDASSKPKPETKDRPAAGR